MPDSSGGRDDRHGSAEADSSDAGNGDAGNGDEGNDGEEDSEAAAAADDDDEVARGLCNDASAGKSPYAA